MGRVSSLGAEGQREFRAAALNSERETERVRRIYDDAASTYDTAIVWAERLLFKDGRRWVCSQARGEILEVAVGTGRNFPFYPAGMRLTGIDLSPVMLQVARQHVDASAPDARLCVSDAQTLPFADATFDTIVATLALCTIPDPSTAIAEAKRVLRAGGRLLLLEHVRSPHWPVRAVQRLLDPLCVRLQADHLLREPLDDVLAQGFRIDCLQRSRWGIVERLVAHKPGVH